MPDHVRVTLENGSEATVSRAVAERHKLKVLDKPAVDARGYALSEKPRVQLPRVTKYDGMKPEELAAEAGNRQLNVEGTGKDGNVLKSDYIAALVEHDASLT